MKLSKKNIEVAKDFVKWIVHINRSKEKFWKKYDKNYKKREKSIFVGG